MTFNMDGSGFVGERLKQARVARGMTGIELARQLHIKRQSISNYETGKRSPSPDVKDKISEILHFPLDFFSTELERAEIVQNPVFYRSMSAATKRARARVEIEHGWLSNLVDISNHYVELPKVNFPNFDVPSDPNNLSQEDITTLAEKARSFWGLKDGPISNSVWLLENNGAIIARKPLYASTLDGFSRWVDERPHIVLSSEKNSAARSRFDLAHELGHLILHRNVSESYLKNSAYFKLIEEQADCFSAAFQFPETAFSREVVRTNLEFLRVLKKRWRLSIAMMIVRLRTLNFIDEKRYSALWKNYSRKGWKNKEPFDDEIPIESPKLIRNSIDVIIENKAATRREILDYLHLFSDDAENCAGLPRGFLKPNYEVRPFRPRVRKDIGSYNPDAKDNLLKFPTRKQLNS